MININNKSDENLPNLSNQKNNIPQCEICFNFDEFSFCNKCFQKFLEKTIDFRNSIKHEKYFLRSSIQEILSKNHNKVISANKKSKSLSKIENINKRCKELEMSNQIKQNLIEELKNKIYKKKENLSNFKQIITKERKYTNSSEKLKNKQNEILLNNDKISYSIKLNFYNFLINQIFFNLADFEIEEFLELQEYVKPDIKKASNKNINIKSDLNDFDKLTNVLSVSNMGNFTNMNQKEYEIKYDKFFKFKNKIIINEDSIDKLNNFIYTLILFQKIISSFLDISLPYNLDEGEYFKIKNSYNDTELNLFLDTNEINEKNLNELTHGYIYLDSNLKYIIKLIKGDERNIKKYKNGFSYDIDHNLNNYELSNFLSFRQLFSHDELNNIKIKNKENKIIVDVKREKISDDDYGFVIIDNFYK